MWDLRLPNPRLFLLAVVLGSLSTASAAAQPTPADTIYVDQSATGADDGSSWTNAYQSLQDALQAARTNDTDDAVWVAAGTYHPDDGSGVQEDDRSASFRAESGIDLRGRFAGTEQGLGERDLSRGTNETVLSGEIQQDDDPSNNAYTVLRLTGGAAGEIRVTGGRADGTGAQGEGGGAHVSGGTLHHAVLTGNLARRGSAVYAENSPTIEVVRATGNHATETGTVYLDGGAAVLRHVTIADNTLADDAQDGANGLQFAGSDATVEAFALGPETTNDVQTDRVEITFNPKVVGDTLYGGGYGETLKYQVSTDDTTFTASGSTTADIPVADGDDLELTQTGTGFLETLVANNTDTEPKPFNVSGHPDEPDYQNTTITIPKSDLVNQYQVVGFPDTSPEGHSTADEYLPHVNSARRFKDRQVDGETLDQNKLYIVENSNSDWNTKAENALNQAKGVVAYPTSDIIWVESTEALGDSVEARAYYNFTSFDEGGNGNTASYEGDYIKNSGAFASGGADLGTTISEFYSAMTDYEEARSY